MGQVGFDRNRIFIDRAADRADVLAHSAARRYGVGGGGQTTKVKDIVFYLCRFNRTCVISNNAAHFGGRAIQAHCAVSVEQVRIFDERTRLVASCNTTDSIRCAANIRVIHKGRRDCAIVMGCYAARFTVGRSDTAHHGVILQCAVCFIAAGNAARIAAARIQRLAAGCVMAASIDAAIVAARNAARILVCYLDRPGFVGNKLDKPFIAARHAAAVGSRRYPCAGFNRHGVRAGCVRVHTDRTACPVKARHTADLAGAADLDSSLAAHAIANDRAQVIPRHAADGGDAIDPAGGAFQPDGAGIIPRRTADVHAAADGNARRRGRIGDAAVVDARDAAEIAVVLLLAAHGILHAAAGDRAVVDARQAARRRSMPYTAVVGAVLQCRISRRITNNAARKVAAVGSIQRSQRNTVRQDIALLIRKIGSVAKAQDTQVLAAVLGVCKGQRGIHRVIADNAAHVGVCINIISVFQPGQRDRAAAAGQLAFRQGIARAKGGQQRAQGVGMLGVAFQCAAQRLGRNDPVIADDAAHNAVSHDLVRVLGRCFRCRRFTGSVHKHKAVHRQIGAHGAAHKMGAFDMVRLNLHGRQFSGAVQADQTTHAVTLAHNNARHAKACVVLVFNKALRVVVTGHAAHIVVAVQHGTDCIIVFVLPGDLAPCAVVAGHAAHKIRAIGRVAADPAQRFQAVERNRIAVGDAVHFIRVIEQNGIFLCRFGSLHTPGGIVYAGNAAHVGCILAKASHQAAVDHVGDGAACAVDRDNAAHIAVAENVAVVRAATSLQIAAHKAAR